MQAHRGTSLQMTSGLQEFKKKRIKERETFGVSAYLKTEIIITLASLKNYLFFSLKIYATGVPPAASSMR